MLRVAMTVSLYPSNPEEALLVVLFLITMTLLEPLPISPSDPDCNVFHSLQI